jgi:hypothetical protein
MLPTKFQFVWPNGFRGEEFKKSTNQQAILVSDWLISKKRLSSVKRKTTLA